MKRFLSIDWDFFIDATADQRAILFPDGGNENFPTSLREYIWDSRYRVPELSKIGVSPEYKHLLKMARDFEGDCVIADSHRFAYDFIMQETDPDEEFEVYNIDFHHDLYNYKTGEERVNCGNWGTILREDRPNMRFVWVKCSDSDTNTIGDCPVDCDILDYDQFKFRFKKGISKSFEYLYLCRSAMWSPPHLDDKFVRIVKILMRQCYTKYEMGIDLPRPYEIPTDFSEYLAMTDKSTYKESWIANE